MHYGFGWEHMVWMTIAWLVGIGFLIALIWGIASRGRLPERGPPEAILKRRYAAGEIDTDEYRRRREELENPKNAA
jgi:putative membrane protein